MNKLLEKSYIRFHLWGFMTTAYNEESNIINIIICNIIWFGILICSNLYWKVCCNFNAVLK